MTMQTHYSKEQYDEVLEHLHNTQELLEQYYEQLAKERKQNEKSISAMKNDFERSISALNHKLNIAESRAETAETLAAKLQTELENIKKSSLWKTVKPLIALKRLAGTPGSMRKQLKKQAKILQRSGLFDNQWYLTNYPDVAASKVDPAEHYLEFGAAEGRKPNASFDSTWYTKHYPDIATAGINPLLHYVLFGRAEGRSINSEENQQRKA